MTYRFALSSDANRERAVRMIRRAPATYVCEIREQTRSDAQNRLMWQLLTDVARSRPGGREHTPDVWKAIFLQACGHEQTFEMGIDGRPFPMGFRSSKLTVAQMADLCTFIIKWGDENGVRWKDRLTA